MLDLSDIVTAFVISAGENPNYKLCIAALEKQSVKVKIDIIKDFRPMSAAFQQMLDRCTTQYFVEVDEDMVLDHNAIQELYTSLVEEAAKNPKVAMVCHRLRDVHCEVDIFGVKIYNHAIFKNYPYNLENMSCEVEQLKRMEADGYSYILREPVIGQHSPLWNNELIFERYLNLMEKFKTFRYVWIGQLPKKLLEKFRKEPSDLNLYALLGAYTSIISDKPLAVGEKDYTERRLQYVKMDSFLFDDPRTATFYITNKCNFKCDFCWRQHKGLEPAPDMTRQVACDLLYAYPSIRGVCICGFGEPFLADTLVDLLTFLKVDTKDFNQYKVHPKFVGLITNGSLLRKKLPEIQHCLPDYISISLNAGTPEYHREVTGTDTFAEVLEGVKLCVSMGIETYMSFVCTKKNLDQILPFLRLAKSLNVRTVYLHNLLPHFDDCENMQFWDLALSNEDQAFFDELKKTPEASIVGKYPVLVNKGEIRRNCLFPWRMIGVNGNGSITICSSVLPPNSANGNILDPVVWHGEYCQKFRAMKEGEQIEVCKKCFRNWKYD